MRLPPNYGSVYKLKGNRRRPWIVVVQKGKTDEGKPIREVLGYFEGQKEALQSLADYHKGPESFASKKITFKELYEICITEHNKGKSESLKRVYEAAFISLKPLHNIVFVDLKAYNFESVIKSVDGSLSKKRHLVTLLSILYKYALKMEIVDRDRSKNLNIGDFNKSKKQKEYSEEEIAHIINSKDDIVTDVLTILLYSGMRISELLTLKKTDVNIQEGYFKGGIKTEAGKERIIPIHDNIQDLVSRYYNSSLTYLIEQNIGKEITYSVFKTLFDRYVADNKLNLTIHQSRHTFVTTLERLGAKDHIVKAIVGHAQTDFTKKVYTHVSLEELKQTVSLLVYC